MLMVTFLVLLFLGVIGFFIFLFTVKKDRVEGMKKFAMENGFQVDYQHLGLFGIERAAKRYIFFIRETGGYEILESSDIFRINKESHNHYKTVVHYIKFNVKSLDYPERFVSFSSERDRDLWYSRILALWKS